MSIRRIARNARHITFAATIAAASGNAAGRRNAHAMHATGAGNE
ncbi:MULTISPECIES: hypothetical protein [Rhodanobacter]|nr:MULTISPECIES: hypothetical protein [Rhodanobacter]